VINNFPVNLARKMGADYTILVDVTLDFETHADVRNVVDLVMRSAQITGNQLNNLLKLQADLVIRPDVGHIHWSEFMRINELIKTGADATQAALPLIGENLAKLNSPLRKAFTRRRINKAKDEIL
jgi:NTE family protein